MVFLWFGLSNVRKGFKLKTSNRVIIMRKLLLTLLTVSISVLAVRADSLTNGLVAFFPFNGNSADASGNGHDATIVGSLITLTNGAGGATNSAYRFGGGDSQIMQGSGIDLANTSLSVSLWFKRDYLVTTPDHGWLLQVGCVGQAGKNLHIAADYGGAVRFSFWSDDFDIASPSVGVGVWSHIVCTFDNATNERRIYLDGNLVATNIAAIGFSGAADCFKINPGFPDKPAMLDQLRFYNRVLNQNEINRLYLTEGRSKLSIETAAVRLSWFAQSNISYQVQWTTDQQSWSNLTTVVGNDTDTNVVDWVDGTKKFYRLATPE